MKSFDPSLTTKGEGMLQLMLQIHILRREICGTTAYFIQRIKMGRAHMSGESGWVHIYDVHSSSHLNLLERHLGTKVWEVTLIRYQVNPHCKRWILRLENENPDQMQMR